MTASEAVPYGGDKYGGGHYGQNCIMYEVKPGDYCYKIAMENNIPYQQFLSQNPGLDCTRLYPGQSLCLIPTSYSGWGSGWSDNGDSYNSAYQDSKSSQSSCKTYTISEGDLCSRIAYENNISVRKLLEINSHSPSWNGCSRLVAGQTICVA
ncbi:hypothetical protein BX070DRAFT_235985 [Coemansia spiralis]|nr:hypothetical protein BX070DRAFT_235985 [Coemansia spiralis]